MKLVESDGRIVTRNAILTVTVYVKYMYRSMLTHGVVIRSRMVIESDSAMCQITQMHRIAK